MSEQSDVTILTNDEFDEGVRKTIESSGFTESQLRGQSAEGKFENDLARRTWFAVSAFLD